MTAWPIARLGDVATMGRKTVSPEQIEQGTPYVGLENIARGGSISNVQEIGGIEVASVKFRFTDQHLLFGKLRPNLGKIARPTFSGVCSTDILPIAVGPTLDRDYLAHFLSQQRMIDFAASRTSGANLPRLSPAELAKFDLPVPPLKEQRRIAAILDQADALRTKRRESLAHLDDLAQSIFYGMLKSASDHAMLALLGDLTQITSGITKGRKVGDTPTRPVPYLAVSNVHDRSLSLEVVKDIEATAAEIDRYRLRRGDLVLTEGGDPDKLGRGTVWNDELPLCIHQNHIFRVRISDSRNLHPTYLASYVASRDAKNYFLRSAKQTTGIASINMTQLRRLPVRVPSMKVQMEFVTSTERVARQIAVLKAHEQAADALFASLQLRAFSGAL